MKPLSIPLIATTIAVAAFPAQAQPPQQPAAINRPVPMTRQVVLRPADVPGQVVWDLKRLFGSFPYQLFPFGVMCIHQSRSGFFGAQVWARHLPGWMLNDTVLRVVKAKVMLQDDRTATVTVTYALETRQAERQDGAELPATLFQNTEELVLKLGSLQDQDQPYWKMVPPARDPGEPAALPAAFPLVGWMAYHLAQQPGTDEPDEPPQPLLPPAQQAQVNIKMLALGVMQFVQDYGATYAFESKYAVEALQPYMHDTAPWEVPETSSHFIFNGHLSGHSSQEVLHTAETVLFYDGTPGALNYRYDGKAAVGFADGHCALVTPDEAKNLIWDPFVAAAQ